MRAVEPIRTSICYPRLNAKLVGGYAGLSNGKDGATHRVSGRARDNRLVHVTIPDGMPMPRPGDVADVEGADGSTAVGAAGVRFAGGVALPLPPFAGCEATRG